MCIEVKGQATPTTHDPPSVLLEQWLVQVLPKRSGGGGGGGGEGEGEEEEEEEEEED